MLSLTKLRLKARKHDSSFVNAGGLVFQYGNLRAYYGKPGSLHLFIDLQVAFLCFVVLLIR